jgi:transmembrane sensor
MRDDEGEKLKKWLADAQNRDAILEAAGLWHGRDVQSILFALTGVSPQRRRAPKPVRTLFFPLVVALISTGALMWMMMGHGPRRPANAENVLAVPITPYSTRIGETRQITLADGSVLTLNTNTIVRVAYSQRAREITLERGEATFKVADASAAPFNVIAGQRTFQAQGAQFNLRTLPDNVDLIVIEGKVKILDARPREPKTPARRRDVITYGEQTISASEEALVEPGFQSVSLIDASDMEARLAWQKGMIIFSDKALEDAIAEVERYTSTKFVLTDRKLGALRVSGSFRTGNVNSVRLALRRDFYVASRRDTRGRIVLSPLS